MTRDPTPDNTAGPDPANWRENFEPTIGDVLVAGRTLETVTVNASVRHALTLMLAKDYSQLPVMNTPRSREASMISLKDLAQFLLEHRQGLDARIGAIRTRPVPILWERDKFRDAVTVILQHDSVLVRNGVGEVHALLTAHDLLTKYHEEAEPLLLLEGIERSLRHLLEAVVDPAELSAILSRIPDTASGKGNKEASDRGIQGLSLGEIRRCLQDPQVARRLGLGADMRVLDRELDGIRQIRNAVFHFDQERLRQDPSCQLRSFRDYLEGLILNWRGPASATVPSTGQVDTAEVAGLNPPDSPPSPP